jgi:dTDP-4-amino-4,6-dideoxygalactose transaminase
MIPFVDLKAQYLSIKNEIDNTINECITTCNFIRGKAVTDFEDAFAKYIGTEYCLGCGNGTDALEIILQSLGIGPGDEVIVPALTWIATAECVNNVGSEPVFVDINPINYSIDYKKIEDKISNRTKAVIAVHLYGCPADLHEISAITKKNNLHLIEDCAQAHGAEYFGKKIGTFGIASAFSFFPSKNLGAYGDGGAILTNDKKIAEKARMLSNHGQFSIKHSHKIIGRNSRLDTIQSCVLNVKLHYLDEWNQKRILAAQYYRSILEKKDGIIVPLDVTGIKHVYHLFVIRVKNRKKITNAFIKNNISFGIHYPKALPFIEAYGYKNLLPEEFPVSSVLTAEILSLPIYPEITNEQIDFVCQIILENL